MFDCITYWLSILFVRKIIAEIKNTYLKLPICTFRTINLICERNFSPYEKLTLKHVMMKTMVY